MTPFLEMNGVRYSIPRSDEALKVAPTPFHVDAIQFCCEWMAGREDFVFHTSGSTGLPKEIHFRRHQLIASAQLSADALNFKAGETALICLNTRLIAGAMMLVRSLITGMNIVLEQPAANPLKAGHSEIHFAALVPYQVVTLLQTDTTALQKIKTVIIGGAPLHVADVQRLRGFPNQIYATYGMTETITHIALQKLSGSNPQEQFHALNTVTLATDNRGCLTIQAPHLGSAAIITNDRVQLLDDKTFMWLGRLDRVINSGGKKIEAERIEQAVESIFSQNGLSHRFFVAGLPDPILGECITLFVEGLISEDKQALIKAELEDKLDRYEIPKKIIGVTRFAETASQKVDRLATIQNALK